MNETPQADMKHLIAQHGKQSMTRKLTAIHTDIEKAIEEGVSYEQIVIHLSGHGFEGLTLSSFTKALYRIRKRRQRENDVNEASAQGNSQNFLHGHKVNAHENTPASATSGSVEAATISRNQSLSTAQKQELKASVMANNRTPAKVHHDLGPITNW